MAPLVLITGCSSGFGRRMVTHFLEAGWTVVATLRNAKERQKNFTSELKKYGDRLMLVEFDVTSPKDRAAVTKIIRQKGKLDALVNNAGFMLLGAFEETTEEQMRRQFDVNFWGVALLIQDMLPFLRQSKGIIINISSIFGVLTWPLSSLYCASKHALEGLSASLKQELKPHGVRVALIEPGSHGATDLGNNTQWAHRILENSIYQNQTTNYRQLRENLRNEKTDANEKVARLTVKIAHQKSPRLHHPVGRGMTWVYRLVHWFPEWVGVRLMGKFVSAKKTH